MTVYRHSDGTYHLFPDRQWRRKLTPIPGRPNWFTDHEGVEHYVEPDPPAQIAQQPP